MNRKLAIIMLTKMGYQPDVVSNGLEVLKSIRRKEYDVILMDVQMPEVDGLEASRRIRQQQSSGHRPYIVAITANAMAENRQRCLAAGMDEFLSKPIQPEVLFEVLCRFTGQRLPTTFKHGSAAPEAGIPTEMRELFTRETYGQLVELRKALDRSDFKALSSEAHRLKGSALLARATPIAEICEMLEREQIQKSQQAVRELLHQLKRELESWRHSH